ncbi:hypothetical protein MRX96_014215 [Rhipicephalus microplus]
MASHTVGAIPMVDSWMGRAATSHQAHDPSSRRLAYVLDIYRNTCLRNDLENNGEVDGDVAWLRNDSCDAARG